MEHLSQDAALFAAISREAQRQRDNLELIASENYASPAVREAMATCLTNKYAEGYPGRRYYGCLLYTSPSPRDRPTSRMPSSA